MDEYTPTTDEVRRAYGDARCVTPYADHDSGCPEEREFDRWLAAHDAEVREECALEAKRVAIDIRGRAFGDLGFQRALGADDAAAAIRALGGGSR